MPFNFLIGSPWECKYEIPTPLTAHNKLSIDSVIHAEYIIIAVINNEPKKTPHPHSVASELVMPMLEVLQWQMLM